jgi:hypothetical protein
MRKIGQLTTLAVIGLLVFSVINSMNSHKSPPSPPQSHPLRRVIGIGETGVLSAGKGDVLVAVDVPALDEIISASVAHDNDGLTLLVLNGRAYFLPNFTAVRVIAKAGFMYYKTRVRVLRGRNRGRSGWVPNEFVWPPEIGR